MIHLYYCKMTCSNCSKWSILTKYRSWKCLSLCRCISPLKTKTAMRKPYVHKTCVLSVHCVSMLAVWLFLYVHSSPLSHCYLVQQTCIFSGQHISCCQPCSVLPNTLSPCPAFNQNIFVCLFVMLFISPPLPTTEPEVQLL